jgi:hypothetical protein
MTRRDTYILTVVAVLGTVGAFWFLALSPKRAKLSGLDKDIATAEQSLQQAKQEKVKFAQDQIAFPRLYASLGRLGKAVPSDEDVPSLLVQLNHAAAQANVDFRSVELKLALAEKAAASAAASAPPATPPAGGEAGSATPAAGSAQPAAPAAGATTPPAGGQAAPAAGGATASASASTAAPAAGATATAAPAAPGAGFQILPFVYAFKGDFFNLEDMIHNMNRLVERQNRQLAIAGRLITIQGFSMKRGKITVLATTYMLPADQGLLVGATPQGPAGTDPAAPQAAAAGTAAPTTPTAAVTTP